MHQLTPEEARAFLLERPRTAKLATVRADGRPHVAPVWFDLDGEAIIFTTQRLTQHQQIVGLPGTVVQDRSLYEDAAVFAASLHAQGILAERDYATYQQLYAAIARELRPPDLVVFLRASVPTLLARIAGRARPAELAIQPGYLASLERHYAAWVAGWTACPVLTLDTDQLDLVTCPADRRLLIDSIVAALDEWRQANLEETA